MRYLVLLGLTMCALPALAYNESVAAIAYNPSRLGAYSNLKAVDKLILKGGLKVTNENHTVLFVTASEDKKVHLKDTVGHPCTSVGDTNCNTVEDLWPLVYWVENQGRTVGEVSSSMDAQQVRIRGGKLTANNMTITGKILLPQANLDQGRPACGEGNGLSACPETWKQNHQFKIKTTNAEVKNTIIVDKLKLAGVTINRSPKPKLAFVDRLTDDGEKARVLVAKDN